MSVIDIFSKRMKRGRGEMPDVYRYDVFPMSLKSQIVMIWRDTLGRGIWAARNIDVFKEIVGMVRKERGVFELQPHTKTYELELATYFLSLHQEGIPAVEQALDVVEFVFGIIRHLIDSGEERGYRHFNDTRQSCGDAIDELNARFSEHGVGYQFEADRIIRTDSNLTHAEIVKPALQLLAAEEFHGPNVEFLEAHEHYRHGDYPGCLIKCLRAFESTMKIICDNRRWSYDKDKATAQKLIKACLDAGLVPVFSEQQLTSVRTLLESGIPTVRNKKAGHGHGATPVPVPQHLASFGLHSTASNILLLVQAYKALGK